MAEQPVRPLTLPSGIASVGLGETTRQVPADEPPTLPPNSKLSVIGKSPPRQDARAKVTGATRFTVDISLPDMRFARILRSPHAHASVRRIDISAAQELTGIDAVLVLASPDDPAKSTLRYEGAPVVAVAATSMAVAEAALQQIHVDYQQLPFVSTMEQARGSTAPLVHDEDSAPQGHPSGFPARSGLPLERNVRGPALDMRGDVALGFSHADALVEAEYHTQVQTHCCLEPHAVVADWHAEGLTVYMSTQFTAGVRQELADAFHLPLAKVRVVVDGMGGGFGSKSRLGNYGHIAVQLSRQIGAPVKLFLDRREEQLDSGNRPATWQRLRVGARADGMLTAISLLSYGTAGVTVGAGVGNNAQALYTCANFESAQYDVFINAGPACAMRGPGNTPGAFGLEQAIDELADKLQLDPLALRDRIDPSAVRREERRIGAQHIGWASRHLPGADPGPIKRGIGVAQSIWGSNVHTNAACEVRILRDGTVEVLSSVQDIGTGIKTVLAQVVAEELGLRPEQISVRIGDTEFPAGPPSYGSRTTASITPPARTAAWRAKQALFREVAVVWQAKADELIIEDGLIRVYNDPKRHISFKQAASLLRTERISEIALRRDDYDGFRRRFPDAAMATQDLGGVQFAAVAVDTETGIIRVERVVAVHDCGRPIHPKQIESQVQGGVLMGISYALFEERVLDPMTGRMVNADLEQYKLLGICDAPQIDFYLLEDYRANSATDAYGIAEPANIATAAAVANAVYNATGVRIRNLPMTPAVVLEALCKIGVRT